MTSVPTQKRNWGRGASDRAKDEFFESYLHWREACENAHAAYERWLRSEPERRRLAFAAYRAALDGEDYAARVHSVVAERLRDEIAA